MDVWRCERMGGRIYPDARPDSRVLPHLHPPRSIHLLETEYFVKFVLWGLDRTQKPGIQHVISSTEISATSQD